MPELFDLERAFEALGDDVAAHTHAPGAERASRAARRRRTTRLARGVLALAVVAAGGVGLIVHRSDRTVVDPADGMPAPQVLTGEVLDAATSGWVSGWQEPTDAHQLDGDYAAPGARCGSRLTGADDEFTPVHVGAAVFLSGRSATFLRGGVATTSAQAARIMPPTGPIEGCDDVHRSAPTADTELVTATATDQQGTAVFAVVRWHERVAFLGVMSPSPTDSTTVEAAVGQALLAAIQDERTVTVTSPALQMQMGGGSAGGTGPSSAPSYSMTGPTGAQLQQAFGTWAAGYDPAVGATSSVAMPDCLDDPAPNGSGRTVGNAAMVGLGSYASDSDAGDGLNAIAKSLAGCGFRVEGSWTDGPLMATRTGDKPLTAWFVKDGSRVASVVVDRWADPPQAVTDAVDQVLSTAVASATLQPEATGSAAVQPSRNG